MRGRQVGCVVRTATTTDCIAPREEGFTRWHAARQVGCVVRTARAKASQGVPWRSSKVG